MTASPPAPGGPAPPGLNARLRSSGIVRFLLFKVGRSVLVVLAATMATQALLSFTPGGISAAILGEAASPEAIRELDQELGLDRPFLVQYADWAGNVLQGDLGTSPVDNRRVSDVLRDALPVTIELVVLATALALVASILLSMLAVRNPGGVVDRLVGVMTSIGLALPTFVLAPVLIYVVAVRLRWLPVTGWTPLTENVGENLKTAILPAVAIAISELAVFQRLFRGDLVAVLEEDYIDAARARGISETRVLVRHAFRPASISLMTVVGLIVGRLLGGTLVVESLFVLPGVGRALQGAIIQHDLVTVQGFVMFLASAYVIINLVVDLLYGIVDPRIRAASR